MDLNMEKVKTKTDGFTLKVNGYYLHSKYNPEREAKQFAEQYFKKIISIYCLVMGLAILQKHC